MASSVYYKFKSSREESRVTFDGTGISVFDLKQAILQATASGKASDFDLVLYDSANTEYADDQAIIPRSSSVVAKRVPAGKPGKGKAAAYLAAPTTSNATVVGARPAPGGAPGSQWRPGAGAMSRRFDGREDKPSQSHSYPTTQNNSAAAPSSSGSAGPITAPIDAAEDEAARIKAMFQANAEHWEETQERMSHATPVYFPRGGGPPKRSFHQPQQAQYHESKPLPPGYVCHRCSKRGHWIQDCPTNDDREYDNRPRMKRTTGIPRSFLKAVDVSVEGAPGAGVMVTPDGGFVVAQPDSAAWQKQRARPAGLTAAEIRDRPPSPSHSDLACPICTKLFRDAVKTPCCSKTYCEECIQTHLLEHDFTCPNCRSKVRSLDKLVNDGPTRERVKKYVEEAIIKSRESAVAEGDDKTTDASHANGNSSEQTPNKSEDDADYTETQPGVASNSIHPALSSTHSPALMNAILSNIPAFGTGTPHEMPQIQTQLQQLMILLVNPNPARNSTSYNLFINAGSPSTAEIQLFFDELSARLKQLQQVYGGNSNNLLPLLQQQPQQQVQQPQPQPQLHQQQQMQPMGYMNGMNGMMGMYGGYGVGAGGMMNVNAMPYNGGGGGGYGGYGMNPMANGGYYNTNAVIDTNDSPYQRLPVNNRRRVQKRDRPEDFLDVGNDPKRRFYE